MCCFNYVSGLGSLVLVFCDVLWRYLVEVVGVGGFVVISLTHTETFFWFGDIVCVCGI